MGSIVLWIAYPYKKKQENVSRYVLFCSNCKEYVGCLKKVHTCPFLLFMYSKQRAKCISFHNKLFSFFFVEILFCPFFLQEFLFILMLKPYKLRNDPGFWNICHFPTVNAHLLWHFLKLYKLTIQVFEVFAILLSLVHIIYFMLNNEVTFIF